MHFDSDIIRPPYESHDAYLQVTKGCSHGLFEDATEAERYEELRELVERIEVPTVFKAEHVTFPEPIRGRLPEDRDTVLVQIDRLIDDAKAGKLDGFRQMVHAL